MYDLRRGIPGDESRGKHHIEGLVAKESTIVIINESPQGYEKYEKNEEIHQAKSLAARILDARHDSSFLIGQK